jgi:hypothetical protein
MPFMLFRGFILLLVILMSNCSNATVPPAIAKPLFSDSAVVKHPTTSGLKQSSVFGKKVISLLIQKIAGNKKIDPAKKKHQLGIISFACGLLALTTFLVAPVVGLIAAVVGVITGISSLTKKGKAKKVFAIIGLVLSGLVIGIFIVALIIFSNGYGK